MRDAEYYLLAFIFLAIRGIISAVIYSVAAQYK